jgi:hypothetical protein
MICCSHDAPGAAAAAASRPGRRFFPGRWDAAASLADDGAVRPRPGRTSRSGRACARRIGMRYLMPLWNNLSP